MKERVKKLLIKWGNNEDDVEVMVEKHFDIAVKSYPEEGASFIAEFIRTIY